MNQDFWQKVIWKIVIFVVLAIVIGLVVMTILSDNGAVKEIKDSILNFIGIEQKSENQDDLVNHYIDRDDLEKTNLTNSFINVVSNEVQDSIVTEEDNSNLNNINTTKNQNVSWYE